MEQSRPVSSKMNLCFIGCLLLYVFVSFCSYAEKTANIGNEFLKCKFKCREAPFQGRYLDILFFFRKFAPKLTCPGRQSFRTVGRSNALTKIKMKKEYLAHDMRISYVGFEVNFLTSPINTGGSTGEDLDDPDPFDPWS
jgi:hypothetical protein